MDGDKHPCGTAARPNVSETYPRLCPSSRGCPAPGHDHHRAIRPQSEFVDGKGSGLWDPAPRPTRYVIRAIAERAGSSDEGDVRSEQLVEGGAVVRLLRSAPSLFQSANGPFYAAARWLLCQHYHRDTEADDGETQSHCGGKKGESA